MPSPVLIASNEFSVYTCRNPFQGATGIYAVCLNLSTNALDMFKSTDAGLTWTLKDGAHSPVTAGEELIAATLRGTLVYCVYPQTATNLFSVSVFDTASDTWGSAHVSTIDAGISATATGGVQFRASDSKLVVLVSDGSAALYFTFDTGSNAFSATVACGPSGVTQLFAIDLFAGAASDELWLVFFTLTGTTRTIVIQRLKASTLSALTTVGTITDAGSSQIPFFASSDGTTFAFGWIPTGANFDVVIFDGAVSALPAVTTRTLAGAGGISRTEGALVAVSGTVTFFRSDTIGTGNNPLAYYQDSGSGFGSATVLEADFSNFNDSAGALTALLGFVGNDLNTSNAFYVAGPGAGPTPPTPPPPGPGLSYAQSG